VTVNGEANSATTKAPAKTLRSQLLRGQPDTACGVGLVGVTNPALQRGDGAAAGPYRIRPRHGGVHDPDAAVLHYAGVFQVVCAEICGEEPQPPEERVHVFASLQPARMDLPESDWPAFVLFKHPLTAYLNSPDPFLITLLAI